MRRALRASRAVAFVVAQFIYLAFEEAVRSGTKSQTASTPRVIPSVHERKTLPGTFTAPRLDLDAAMPAPQIRIIDSSTETASFEDLPAQATSALRAEREEIEELPAVLRDDASARLPKPPTANHPADTPDPQEVVATLLRTLRRDVGCSTGADASHRACRAATKLSAFVDRGAVLEALEETITRAQRPRCVQTSAISALGQARTRRAQRALGRMVGVARGRLAWTGTRLDRELLALLLRALDA